MLGNCKKIVDRVWPSVRGGHRRCLGAVLLSLSALAQAGSGLEFQWRELPPVPANQNAWSEAIPVGAPWWRQIGLAGPLVGVQGDRLLVGGGANFPEPAKTATRDNTLGKVYWNEVFVMDLKTGVWSGKRFTLPRALAYSSTVSLPEGVLVIGGEGHETPNGNLKDPLKVYADVFLMRLNAQGQEIEYKPYPSLPRAASYGAAAVVGRTVFMQSGADFWSLDLDAPERGWKTLPTWPGEPRDLALAAAVGHQFILASGRYKKGGVWLVHQDAYAYDARSGKWSRLPDMPYPAQAGQAYGVRGQYFVVLSGDRNVKRWELQAQLEAARAQAQPGSPAWEQANNAVTFAFDHHAGNNQAILVYDSRTRQWRESGYLPGPAPVTTQPVMWRDELLLVSGETNPGKRTPNIWGGRPK